MVPLASKVRAPMADRIIRKSLRSRSLQLLVLCRQTTPVSFVRLASQTRFSTSITIKKASAREAFLMVRDTVQLSD